MKIKELGSSLLVWGFFFSFFGSIILHGATGVLAGAILGVFVALIETWAYDCKPVVTA